MLLRELLGHCLSTIELLFQTQILIISYHVRSYLTGVVHGWVSVSVAVYERGTSVSSKLLLNMTVVTQWGSMIQSTYGLLPATDTTANTRRSLLVAWIQLESNHQVR